MPVSHGPAWEASNAEAMPNTPNDVRKRRLSNKLQRKRAISSAAGLGEKCRHVEYARRQERDTNFIPNEPCEIAVRNRGRLKPRRCEVRRFFQFRLRTALAFMFLCSLAFGWFGANLREWQAEQQALAAIGPASIEHFGSPGYVPIFT